MLKSPKVDTDTNILKFSIRRVWKKMYQKTVKKMWDALRDRMSEVLNKNF